MMSLEGLVWAFFFGMVVSFGIDTAKAIWRWWNAS